MGMVKFSPGNSKMGSIPSVSLPSRLTCSVCGCWEKCYAHKIERIRPSVKKAYQSNLDLLRTDAESFWREVDGQIKMSRFFRFHVAGDIPDLDYMDHMVSVARTNRHCQILCFTKKYKLVNDYLSITDRALPDNLHLILSGWPGLVMENPFKLPEAHVLFKDGTTTARAGAKRCNGNCAECATTDSGCWVLKSGEQIVFNEH